MAHRTGLRCDASSEARSTHPILCHRRCSSKAVEKGLRSQPACQQTRTCQRRKRRVWRVERGQRSQPAWLRAHPGWRRFQPENRAETQILANVWDNGRPQTAMASSKTGRREVTVFGCGSPAWIRTTIHGSKGRCPTIRRPGNCRRVTILSVAEQASPLRVRRAVQTRGVRTAAHIVDARLSLIHTG
jgi:hypothetical protein